MVSQCRARTVQTTIVFVRTSQATALNQTMNNGMNPINSYADVKRVWASALLHEQINELL